MDETVVRDGLRIIAAEVRKALQQGLSPPNG
jgi:hypothetical protein